MRSGAELGSVRRPVSACRCLLILLTVLLVPLSACRPQGPAGNAESDAARPAELVLRNGAVYTLNAAEPWAAAVAVSGGRIVWVGPESGVSGWIGPESRVFDLGGKMVLPGFQDSHVHLAAGGVELQECALGELSTSDELVAAVKACAEREPGLPWVVGNGWPLPAFPGANPHKSLLDAVVPDRPVFLSAADGHSVWVNSRALEMAGVTRATPDPPNGRIERGPDGEPSGTLRERAVDLVADLLPETGDAAMVDGLKQALEMAAGFGITSIQDASVSEKALRAYAALDGKGALTVRTRAALYVDPAKGLAQVPELVALRQRFRGTRLHPEAVKIFADGVIESHTAALLEPYVDSGDPGKAIWEPAALDSMVAALDREGFQIHVHAIGDGAVRQTLDALEKARRQNGARDSRPHIADLQLIHPDDLARFGRLGVAANFQALWAQEDSYIRDLTVPVLGPERSARLYPLGGVLKAGGTIVGGSDWTVTSMNPLEAIQVAVTRRATDSGSGAAWLPGEAIDLATAVAAYTRNGAWANFLERETGTVEVGKAADLIVLDRNLFESPVHEIHLARVVLTLLEGKEVFRDPAFR